MPILSALCYSRFILTVGSITVSIQEVDVDTQPSKKNIYTKLRKEDRPLLKKLTKLLKRDINTDLYGYVDAIVIYSASQVDSAEVEFDLEDEPLKETSNVSIWNYYHETLVDPTRETVEEAIKNKHYREDECWIKCLTGKL